ncbi:MAG TPA: tetratricopeptide repeat protein, partial [Pirellulales bacterium]
APAHFVVGCNGEAGRWFVDAFHGGDVLCSAECRRRIEQLLGQPHALSDAHLAPASPFEIAVRMLRNLKACHVGQNRWEQALPVQRRLAFLLPDSPVERRDLGLIYLRCQKPHEALTHLASFADAACPADREEVAPYIRLSHRLISELN